MRFENKQHFLWIALTLAGCAARPPQVLSPLASELSKNDPESQLAFWHTLPTLKTVSNDEAFHALLLFANGEDSAADYPARVQQLKERKMLPADFKGAAQEPARHGTIAVVVVQALSIKGGVTMHLFGPSPRYAQRELMYAGLYPPSSPQQPFTGPEFLGIIGRADDYQRSTSASVANTEDASQAFNAVPEPQLNNKPPE
jgi:hypothetical protein